jgi:lysophospholipase L1-like esterase
MLDCNYINLGFSGSARGEEIMAQYIAGIKMSAFVLDYDHNAPTIEHLENTHEKFYRIIRASNKELPIIILSKSDFENAAEENKKRRDIIYKTYIDAIKEGDENVFFIDGELMFGIKDRDSCTVDGCHPNDLGFMRMAEVIYPCIERVLAKSRD